MLKSLIAPYRHLGLRYIPTGGISSDNALDYLALPEVAAVGGTWLVRDNDLKAGNWELIAANIRSAAALLNQR